MILQLGIVFFLSARVTARAGHGVAALPALLGADRRHVSFILLAYTGESVATTFMVTAGMFGALALYGTTTQPQPRRLGQFLFMGLIGVVLASFVGHVLAQRRLQFVISFIGVIVFTGLPPTTRSG